MQKKQIGSLLMVASLCCLVGCQTTPSKTQIRELNTAFQQIGQTEFVTILPQKLRYRARIDTGATTCSISALDIERFERDGKKWVRFRFPVPQDGKAGEGAKKTDIQEYPLTREVPIKRHGGPDQIRPAVKLQMQLGSFNGRVEFTLTDRSKYEYPVLIGRNMLEGNAVVDVSKSYVAEEE